jgi:hypothetical protein
MQQKTPTSEASFAGQIEREESLNSLERMGSATAPSPTTLDDLRGMAWRGVKLSTAFLQRWLNLCEVGVEEIFFALTMLRPFAGVNFEPVTAPRETAMFNSRHLLEEQEFSRADSAPDMPEMPSNYAISWKTPWLYLILLLLIWLLLF